MLAANPMRMEYSRRCQEVVADYNREKDRVTIEETFERLVTLVRDLDDEGRRAAVEGLSEDELALFDLLLKESVTKAERDRLTEASRALLAALERRIDGSTDWRLNAASQADIEVTILDTLWTSLPTPPFTEQETEALADRVYEFIWQRGVAWGGHVAA